MSTRVSAREQWTIAYLAVRHYHTSASELHAHEAEQTESSYFYGGQWHSVRVKRGSICLIHAEFSGDWLREIVCRKCAVVLGKDRAENLTNANLRRLMEMARKKHLCECLAGYYTLRGLNYVEAGIDRRELAEMNRRAIGRAK